MATLTHPSPRDTEGERRWNERVAVRLREARMAAGLTQTEAARQTGHDAQWLSNIEGSLAIIKHYHLAQLARIYGYPIEFFFMEGSLSSFREPVSLPEWVLLFKGDEARAQSHFGMDRFLSEQNKGKK